MTVKGPLPGYPNGYNEIKDNLIEQHEVAFSKFQLTKSNIGQFPISVAAYAGGTTLDGQKPTTYSLGIHVEDTTEEPDPPDERSEEIEAILDNLRNDSISFEQAINVEGQLIIRELEGEYEKVYGNIYGPWLDAHGDNMESIQAAYDAGYDLCVKYIIPKDTTDEADKRGIAAKKIYNVMVRE
jgi:hypothetical protein